ncbi:hypothetical protein [Hymenobacter lapidiphilus]|uniref:hypothetical protein n=1 Tax=Hymenobacter sp. CCM 8763 TaxID=2303334 RepID=UPI001F5B533B|nr:hypothetical protein [Hymenobacter sp. CCM 8763]
MATQMPQCPGDSHLAQILCDADLDYLGRPADFWPVSQTLFEELTARGLVADEAAWLELQVHFLGTHHYWTRTAIARREAAKQERLEEVKERLESLGNSTM